MDPEEEKKILELKTQWEKDAEQKGKIEGKIEGERTILGKFIKAQFGEASEDIIAQLTYLTSLDLLDGLTDRLFPVRQLEEARKLVDEAYKEQQKINAH